MGYCFEKQCFWKWSISEQTLDKRLLTQVNTKQKNFNAFIENYVFFFSIYEPNEDDFELDDNNENFGEMTKRATISQNMDCVDKMETCPLIVKHDLCNTQSYYTKFCCLSCTQAIIAIKSLYILKVQ